MELQQALAIVKANGYRVTKPKPKAAAPKLNALGLPMNPNFDPNYKMKHKVPTVARLYAPQNFQWVQ